MRDLDDAALERRLREVLEEHLGALPLDLTVDELRSPPGNQESCPAVSPGPRHHPARGRSLGARRWGAGRGLRRPAPAVGRPAGARTVLRRDRDCNTAPHDGTDPELLRVTLAHPEPRSDMDGSPSRWAIAVARLDRRPLRARRRGVRRCAYVHRWQDLAGHAAWRRRRATSACSRGRSLSWQDTAVGWWNPQDGPDYAGKPPITARDIVTTVQVPACADVNDALQGPDRVDRHRTQGHRRRGPLRPRLGRLGQEEAGCPNQQRVGHAPEECRLPPWGPQHQAGQRSRPEGRMGGRGLRAGRLPGPGLRLVQPRWRALDRDGAEGIRAVRLADRSIRERRGRVGWLHRHGGVPGRRVR